MDVITEAAHLAGKIILDRFNTSLEVSFKGRADIVTDVDLAAEKAVLELLRGEFPEFGVLAEESSPLTPVHRSHGSWTPWTALAIMPLAYPTFVPSSP